MKDANILLVDDEKAFVNTMSKRLEKRELKISKAFSGEEALASIDDNPNIEVVILDINMPGIDGIETLRRVKETHKFVEVIILTGYGKIDSYKEATELGVFSYLEKPYDMDKLLEEIKNAYYTRLKKKFQYDKKRREELEVLCMGSSPLAILKSLMEMDRD